MKDRSYANLIKASYIANKYYSNIIFHTGINEIEKRVTFTDDKDTLPCEITRYRLSEFANMSEFWSKVYAIEDIGYIVCVNTMDIYYESNVENCTIKTCAGIEVYPGRLYKA